MILELEKGRYFMTLKQALEVTLFKNHKVYIEKNGKSYKLEEFKDLENFNLDDDITILNRGFISTTIKL